MGHPSYSFESTTFVFACGGVAEVSPVFAGIFSAAVFSFLEIQLLLRNPNYCEPCMRIQLDPNSTKVRQKAMTLCSSH